MYYVTIETIDVELQTVTVKNLDTGAVQPFKVEKPLLDTLLILLNDAKEAEEPAVVRMNFDNQFVL